ncbi:MULTISPECIES: DUF3320 domain-containing protein [unclassified Pseudomonas]|uniref:DUF3320 domain-containing protein n=1 Tax=unclassified Pseudomonas TaxID=196821 RepID=UPI0024540C24|nr:MULTISPECIES: DUF3320 domain-containing protein [unclassified Pseudomonas]MDH4561246.1 DUF3320 domain-containing protein [Pseudomonas sp. BN411]MDH4656974.1 DUF3320 domain-containing protein [Pseudomonas sp. BN606]
MSNDMVENGSNGLLNIEIAESSTETAMAEDTTPIESAEPSPVKAVRIQTTVVTKLNLADYQNAVPLIRELRVVNETEQKYSDLELTLTSDPAVFKPKTWHISELGAEVFRQIPGLDLAIDASMLAKLTEAEYSTLNFVLTCKGTSSDELRAVVAQTEHPLEVLPRNQWGGLAHLPELTAAFVQPNDLAVETLLKKAAELLRKHGKSAALDGYASGPAHAWEILSAVWSTVVAMGLDYALPPASFERDGQKVRSPSHLAEHGLATCFDLTMLFCALLEQAGLNPLIIFTHGHAFAGVWLKNEEFTTTVVDDITALRKRIKLNELVLFETTLATQRPSVGLRYAIERGADHLAEGKEATFEMALDIRRARLQRIKPMASGEAQTPSGNATQDDATQVVAPEIEAPLALPSEVTDNIDVASLDPKDRLGRWQRKLLDLSLRNNLLNFKTGKKALRFEAPKPSQLEDLLASGKQIKLMTRPDLMDGADPRDKELYESRERENVRQQHALDALKRNEVFIALPQAELDSRLIELYRGARTNLQEGGANTLFLALGFLSWTREDRADQRYRAPLILVPVTLERKSARSGFTITLHDDEPRFNPTLIEMLRQDFELNLGVAEGELPRDESGLDIDAIWRNVASAVKDIKGWEVSEDVVLSMFSFAKYLMWKDLAERTDALRDNPVVRHLLDTPRDAYNSTTNTPFPANNKLDAEYSPKQVFCPLAYDSSQLSAVLAASQQKDFVLIGPPGTGKSQTIVNMIAQFIAEDKRVLFVSEKIAALNVVYRRLREVGLGEFCLEVHSNKASKTDVLSQLNAAWQARGDADVETWKLEAERLESLRKSLNVYVDRLHYRYPNGLSIYDAIGATIAGKDLPAVALTWPTPLMHDREALHRLLELADRLEVNAQAIGYQKLTAHPLGAIRQHDWSPSWQQLVIQAAREAIPAIRSTEAAAASFIKSANLPDVELTRASRNGLSILANVLPKAAGQDWRFSLRPDARLIAQRLQQGCELVKLHREINSKLPAPWSQSTIAACQGGLDLLEQHSQLTQALPEPLPVPTMVLLSRAIQLFDEISALRQCLSVPYTPGIEDLDVTALLGEWERAEGAFWPMSWLSKRRIKQQLSQVIDGEHAPNIPVDLQNWISLRELRRQIDDLGLGADTVEFWRGARSDFAAIRQVKTLQGAILAAKENRAWEDDGFDLITQEVAGPTLKSALLRMRELRALHQKITTLGESLNPVSEGIWQDLNTCRTNLVAAVAFQQERRGLVDEGHLEQDHELIATGKCGPALRGQYALLKQRSEAERNLKEFADLRELATGIWAGLHTKVDVARAAVEFQGHIATAIAQLAQNPDAITAVKSSLLQLLGDGNALLEPQGLVSRHGQQYLKSTATLANSLCRLVTDAHFSNEGTEHLDALPLQAQLQQCEGIIQAEHNLHAWSAWCKVRDEAASVGLRPLIQALETGLVVQGTIKKVFQANYARWWLNATVDQEPTIRNFVSVEHEQRIRDFRALDEKFTALTRDLLRARLCAELPTPDSVTQASEWGVLRHEISKKTRHKPLRELISTIPAALAKLTPCMLMSPLSIAQYLSTTSTVFDVVIFDESSQIPVWDAIGAIARGRQVIMVGDPKQMPPTSFFDRAETTNEDDDVEPDLESILDECLSANLPTLDLNWHYRSRHESLITFSNHRYYKGNLVTFPSPVTTDRAVSLNLVQGVYDRGGSRTNLGEAKALVAHLVARLRTREVKENRLTFGVVTFNSEQQRLIEDLLDAERRNDPLLEGYFADTQLEPVFVKNLESVQGDERDIIYFSITYGRDAAGHMTMSFGPMNRPGGERRLNVAVTRARHELLVFSTISPEVIDLARTQSIGVRDMKHFLEFAERGPRAIIEATADSLGSFDSPFEEQVAKALGRKGWHVVTQVGVSAFRIDLAVVHPDASGRYLAGVECDGATYHRSATARDRDKLREQVLRGLGWEILRVWSTDWWINPAGTAEKLHEHLEALLAESRTRKVSEQADLANHAATVEEVVESISEEAPPTEAIALPVDNPAEEPRASSQYARAIGIAVGAVSAPTTALYRKVDPLVAVETVDPEAFFEDHYDGTLASMIAHIVAHEGPVLDLILAQRIARAHGWVRTGNRIRERVSFLAEQSHRKTVEDLGDFYWPSHLDDDNAVTFRKAADADNLRGVDEISQKELEALAREALARGEVRDNLLYAMARDLGLQKVSAQSKLRLEQVIASVHRTDAP